MYSPATPSTFETQRGKWPVWVAAAYLRGRGIHFGGAVGCIFPRRAATRDVYAVVIDDQPGPDAQIVAASPAPALTPAKWNWVCVEAPTTEALQSRLALATQYVAPGGHILVLEPTDREPAKHPRRWGTVKVQHEAPLGDVPHRLTVLHRTANMSPPNPDPRPRACVVRYGAFGDQVLITPVLRELRVAGYHVTVNAASGPHVLHAGNPNIDNVVVQERDVVLNADLGEYWEFWRQRYDRYINLSESVEGALLRVEGRRNYYTPAADRRANAEGVNYYEHTLALAGFAGADPIPAFYPTAAETDRCARIVREARRQRSGPVVLWTMKGSSYHKVYPMAMGVIDAWLANHGGTVLLGGGPDAVMWSVDDPARGIVSLIGRQDIRTAFALTAHVDLVVGPETGVMNAAGCFDTPKVLLLSHSRAASLARHWRNVVCLEPDPAVSPCYPCYQMHYTLESCPRVELAGADGFDTNEPTFITPRCTVAITPERVLSAMETQLGLRAAPVTTKR